MTDEDLAAVAAWLRRTQGIALEPAALREPATVAAKLSALVGGAAEARPFGAEPSGFELAAAALKDAGDKDAR